MNADKIAKNSVFDCQLSPVGRQMTIENSVSIMSFVLRSSIVLTFSIDTYPVCVCVCVCLSGVCVCVCVCVYPVCVCVCVCVCVFKE